MLKACATAASCSTLVSLFADFAFAQGKSIFFYWI